MLEEKRKYKISFSEYSAYLQCPHKWYLIYCLGMPSDTNEELIFGSLMHKSIEDIIQKKSLTRPAFYDLLVKSNLKEELEKHEDVEFLAKFNSRGLPFVFVRQCVELLKVLDFFNRFNEYEVLHVEYQLDGLQVIELKDIIFTFKGYIDLVLKHKITGKILLIDWKTSRKKWDIKKKLKDNEDFFTQLGLYKKFYSIKENIPLSNIECRFFNLPREESREMSDHIGVLNETYIEYLSEKFQNTCIKISQQSPFELNKAKITTKKNYCNRCHLNKEYICNDYDEFQNVNI